MKMAPLQGKNLGQRHAYYNQLVKEATASMSLHLPKINYEDSDVDNMIKIDIACKTRNLDYILEVLKCDDMLYISRAIKKSAWITEKEYAHILNPNYLHKQLFPFMNGKAISKLMLQIRLHLKDEIRVKAFYWYVFQKNPKQAWRWLQNCPIKLIESRYIIHTDDSNDISLKHTLRLCRRKILPPVFRRLNPFMSTGENNNAKFLLKTHTEKYLEAIRYSGTMSANRTKLLLKIWPQKIMDHYSYYEHQIDTETFAKFLKQEDIPSFCINISKKETHFWDFYKLKPFLSRIPRDEVLGFLRNILAIRNGTYIESETPEDVSDQLSSDSLQLKKDTEKSDCNEHGDVEELFYALEGESNSEFSKVYRWYEFAPFESAFPDIKRFVFTESVPEERHSLLIVLLTCANYNFEHVRTVIKYYHDKHINEPYIHKIKFVENLLYQHDAFRFDDSTWELVNNLFKSLEVYIESTNKVQYCLPTIIIYNVLHDQPVHEIVEEKYILDTLAYTIEILNSSEQDKLFNYLYQLHVKKFQNQTTDSETGLREAIGLLRKLWTLLEHWKKVDTHGQFAIDKVAELGDINRNSKWNETIKKRRLSRRKLDKRRRRCNEYGYVIENEPYINIPSIYHMLKTYRKALFEHSLILHASEDVCLNALKHDPGLLERYTTETEDLRIDNRISLKRFLRKLRIYWPESLAMQWAEKSLEKISGKTGHKALIRGLLIVLSHKEVLDFIQTRAPDDRKIDWKENEDTEINIQKVIAKNMHLVRPHLDIEVITMYAIGDYVQFSLRSLLSAYSTLRSKDLRKYIETLLNAPVAVQKHGIRLVFQKFKTEEIITRSENLWKSARNASIRMIIFTSILDLLCKEKKTTLIKRIWSLLSLFIDDLNKEENINIYNAMGGKAKEVPILVIGEYFPKVYWFLKSLVAIVSAIKSSIESMFGYAADIVEHLDCDFVEKLLLCDLGGCNEYMLSKYLCNNCPYIHVLVNYLLCSKDSDLQLRKFNNLLRPVLEKYIPCWKNGDPKYTGNFTNFLHCICKEIPRFVFEKKMVMPLEMLTVIKDALVEELQPIEQFYALKRKWEIELAYLKVITNIMNSKTEEYTWEQIRAESTEALGKICMDRLVDDVDKFFPSIYLIFSDAMQNLFTDFNINGYNMYHVYDNMLNCDNISLYLLVLHMMPASCSTTKFDTIMSKIYCHPSKEINLHYVQKFSIQYAEVVHESEEIRQTNMLNESNKKDEVESDLWKIHTVRAHPPWA